MLVILHEHLLDWSNLGLLDYPYISLFFNHVKLWVSNMID